LFIFEGSIVSCEPLVLETYLEKCIQMRD